MGKNSLREKGASLAIITAETVKAGVQYGVFDDVDTVLAQLISSDDDVSVAAVVTQEANGSLVIKSKKISKGYEAIDLDQILKEFAAHTPTKKGEVAFLEKNDPQFLAAKINLVGNDTIKNGYLLLAMNSTRISKEINKTFIIMLGSGLLMLILGAASSIFITRTIMGGIGGEPSYAVEVTRQIADGDLTFSIRTRPGDETSLLATMKVMQASLKTMITQTRDAAASLTTEAKSLVTTSNDVSDRSVQQSESATSMAAYVHQMNASISQVAQSANIAHTMTNEASELCVEGASLIKDTVGKINDIASSVEQSSKVIQDLGEQSNKISSIAHVIKEIADQTNLLALNAAIEAARAGEQGRGFAVVADEVRKLAERTTSSTKEIATMIDGIQKGTQSAVLVMAEGASNVHQGVAMAAKSGDSMNRIDAGAREVRTVVEAISTTLHEQSSAISNLSQNVEKIAQMIEENSAADKVVSGAAAGLEQLAETLKAGVDRFKV